MKIPESHNALSVGILCGGTSSRMGSDKSLLRINGKSFIEKILSEFSDFHDVMVSLAENDKKKIAGARKIFDENSGKGPLEGLHRILSEAKNDFVFVCACDMPFITKKVPDFLSQFISSDFDAYVLTAGRRIQPLCALYSKKILPTVVELLKKNELKLKSLLDSIRTKYIPLEISSLQENCCANINTKTEFFELIRPFVFCVSGFKNSGKTRMIMSLLEQIRKEGFSAAVIKHDGHDCFSVNEECDTGHFLEHGAVSTAIFSTGRYDFFANEEVDADFLIKKAASLSRKPDFIMIEGLKDSEYPKIEVLRKGVSESRHCKTENLICVASDFELKEENPSVLQLDAEKPAELFLAIKKYFGIDEFLK